ncbi:Lamin-like protein [Morus notabilis]|uniref:Lamin-like protein n=1 Tax=Morus notabilis TaxID=981085 RepID=W9QUG7_9ROSA|nr:lamin-like protein [Morus notabilis]EXB54654.1 Lamin-like protein [Morus notabilis]
MEIILMAILISGVEYASADIHYVGGAKNTWAPNVNFSHWSSLEHFHLDDWLYFGYNKYQFNVLEVNKTSYESCNDRYFITNVTKGAGRDVFQLKEAKTYYFLSSGGYCFQGMKVAVDVLDIPPAAPPPEPVRNSSPESVSVGHITPLVLLLVANAWLWNFVI